MCRLFLNQDPDTYVGQTRAIRLHGHATSIRLEAAFWDILEEIAAREDMPVARFVSTLYDEILERHGDVPNFASFLRVTCLHDRRHQEQRLQDVSARRTVRASTSPPPIAVA